MSSWLGSRTSAGVLFETDLQLRPSGGSGLLVSSVSAFRRYQLESAWTWEHQALTRARFCAGDAAIGAVFEAFRRDVLQAGRDRSKLVADVLAMRGRMLDAHPNRSGLFDLKHDRGGMVDIEFIVQFLVLAHAHGQPRLLGNLGNIALLNIAGELGLIDRALASTVANAYRDYRRIQHRLRLNVEPESPAGSKVPAEEMTDEMTARITAVQTLWRAVFDTDAPQRAARRAAAA
jgi:glutamate-ammonia-ligase adenylyltransferase